MQNATLVKYVEHFLIMQIHQPYKYLHVTELLTEHVIQIIKFQIFVLYDLYYVLVSYD